MNGMIGGNRLKDAECVPDRETVTQRLERQKEYHERNLGEINQALEALKKNPELQNLIDLVSRVA
jgi:hypothetical protein